VQARTQSHPCRFRLPHTNSHAHRHTHLERSDPPTQQRFQYLLATMLHCVLKCIEGTCTHPEIHQAEVQVVSQQLQCKPEGLGTLHQGDKKVCKHEEDSPICILEFFCKVITTRFRHLTSDVPEEPFIHVTFNPTHCSAMARAPM
jgi:hypothetical protein